jgi:hypothetical protein
MRKEKLVGKPVILKNVFCIENIRGIIVEEYKDIEGILEKIGPNEFFGWDISATVDGQSYEIKTLSQITPIYK